MLETGEMISRLLSTLSFHAHRLGIQVFPKSSSPHSSPSFILRSLPLCVPPPTPEGGGEEHREGGSERAPARAAADALRGMTLGVLSSSYQEEKEKIKCVCV